MTSVEVVERTFVEQQGAVQLILDLEAAGVVTVTSLTLTNTEMEYEQFETIGVFLGWVKRWTSWAIGDWLNFGAGVFGERFAQAASETKLSEATLQHYQFVCQNVPQERRRASLSFGVHALVARDDPKEQTYWLKQAEKKGWGERELRDAKAAKRRETHPPMFPDDDNPTPEDIIEVARAILRDVRPHEDDASLVILPKDDIARLEAALAGV